MTDKLDYYDILATILPGTLLVGFFALCFPAPPNIHFPHFPEAFSVLLLTAVAVFFGNLVGAVGSAIEKTLHKSWGGRPSERALTEGLGRYFYPEEAQRIKAKLIAEGGDGTDQVLFNRAMHRTVGAGLGRTSRYNGLFAYHRNLLVTVALMLVFFIISTRHGSAVHLTRVETWVGIGVLAFILMLVWRRTEQWGKYFVREVLHQYEILLEQKNDVLTTVTTATNASDVAAPVTPAGAAPTVPLKTSP